ncbi:MAG: hypothetical protein QOH81_3289 [Sphingomonadales bacterium]|jgi:diguanylate cyclase (GGDEF)-like protein/PAS domain S-box-containing protein|nr:hypothetical protein [Sphingomonadales bacterium]
MRHSEPDQFWPPDEPLAAAEARALSRAAGLPKDEEAERSDARRLRAMLAFTPHMFWTYHLDTGEEYYSPQWENFTGAADVGRPGGPERLDLVHPEDRARARAAWHDSLATGAPYEIEYRLRHHDGGHRWILSVGAPERDDRGRIVAWYGSCTDVNLGVLARETAAAREKRAQAILDSVPHVIWTADAEGRIDFLSNQWRRFFDTADELGDDERWHQAIHPEDFERVASSWQRSVATGAPFEAEVRVRFGSAERWILTRCVPKKDGEGRILRWYGTCTDIHESVRAKQALEASERLNREMIEASPDCVSLLELDGKVVLVNERTRQVYRAGDAELVGRNWIDRFTGASHGEAKAAVRAARRGGIGQLLLYDRPEGRWWDILVAPMRGPDGKPQRLVVMSRDVTDRKAAEDRAQWAANHDFLTGLPNRYLLQKGIDGAIAGADADGTSFALLLLDIDDFKRVNDTVGHDAGDAMLCTFAARLREALGEDGVVGRLGGDEFAALLPAAGSVAEVEARVQALLDRLAEPCVHLGCILDCRASIGVSLFPADGVRRTELMKNADMALYAAKAAGRGALRLYRGEMRLEVQKRTSMLHLARDALKRGSVRPYYQPKVDLRSGRPVGFEALMRWKHPRRGIQSPASVAAAFDDLSLAAEISDRMIEAVIGDIVRWRGEGVGFGHVAVNAAAAEFRRGDFAERLLERLASAGVPTACFQLEVTETVFVGRGAEYVERALNTLAAEGVSIALDDFGTGYASLSHLKQFPVDIVKIDRSFVCGLEEDPGDAAIVDAVTSLGRRLGKTIVAEGIETERQHALLQALGCHEGQGYFYSRPAPASRVPGLAAESRIPLRAARRKSESRSRPD